MAAPTDTAAQLFDPEALTAYLEGKLPGSGPLTFERHQAGHSNETIFIARGADRWVLRRPPLPPYLPTAHDVAREYRVLAAVADTPVRAPAPLILCEDETVIGAPFHVMEAVDGAVIRDSLPGSLDNDDQRALIGDELVDALVELHAVDWRAAGLEGFGKPTGYVERQLSRWTKQFEGAVRRGKNALGNSKRKRRLRELDEVGRWLRGRLPAEQEHTIVHGDYKLDNVILAPEPPARVRAILDWEMSTIGDPLADVGWMLSFWREPGDKPDGLHPQIDDLFASGGGWRTRAQLVSRYEQRSGRAMTDLRFYTVLAIWKLAILLEGSYVRHLAGQTDDPFFALLADGVPALGERARAVIDAG